MNVACSILVNNNKILACQRNFSLDKNISHKYEFPGGKQEIGETIEETLSREIREEVNLNLSFTQDDIFMKLTNKLDDYTLNLHVYIKYIDEISINSNVHKRVEWADVDMINKLDWLTLDKKIIEEIIKRKIIS